MATQQIDHSGRALGLKLGIYVIALSIASAVVIMKGATDEPYFHFNAADCLVQVGVGVALLVLWAQVAIGVIAGVFSSRLPRWALAILLWACIVCFYLYVSPSGYIADIAASSR